MHYFLRGEKEVQEHPKEAPVSQRAMEGESKGTRKAGSTPKKSGLPRAGRTWTPMGTAKYTQPSIKEAMLMNREKQKREEEEKEKRKALVVPPAQEPVIDLDVELGPGSQHAGPNLEVNEPQHATTDKCVTQSKNQDAMPSNPRKDHTRPREDETQQQAEAPTTQQGEWEDLYCDFLKEGNPSKTAKI